MNGHTRTVEATMPYGGKNLDIYYRGFAEALDTGDLGHLPRIEDAVAASAYAQSMVDQALDREVANFQ
jgi:hypothetical protein